MTNSAVLIIAAVICGIAVIFQSQFVGLMDQGVGSFESVFITYVGGAVLINIIMTVVSEGVSVLK